MRAFTLKTATLTALLVAVPFAGAYASESPSVIVDQAQGLEQGIADARQENRITPSVAQWLHMRAVHISQAAESAAARDHGRIPAAQSQQLLAQLDNLNQTLLFDTGGAFDFLDRGTSGIYPN
jgi:hypothetical protein